MYSILALLLLVRSALGQEGVEKALRKLRDSVDRFEANLHRAVDDYGRTGLVRGPLDEMASHQFRLEDHSDVDFPKAVAQAEQRLQLFFDSKTAALRRLVSAAERAATRLDPDKPVASLLDRECVLHLRQVNRSSVKNEAIWRNRAQVPQKSGVHVATESYKCSGPVVRDFGWTGQQQLDDQMADNARQDPALLRQYIGTYSGLTRVFPGFHWDIGPEQFSVDLFDPRFRPWFVVAESGPRDILFLVDFSGSAKGVNAHLIKTSVMAVLQTLSPNDFFSGIWYNSRRERVLANCTEPADGFIQATSRNKLLFRRFLDRIDERDQATLPAALEMSFGEFLRDQPTSASANSSDASSGPANDGGQQRPQSGRSGGHQLILLFTDGIEFWPTEEVQRYHQAHPNEPIRVFGHSVGYGRGPQPALDWLTCQTRAGPGQAVVGTVADVRLKARMYLTKMNELLALAYRDKASLPENRPISWPVPYMDVQRGGPVISLSMPVLGPQPSAYQDLETAKQRVRDGKQPQQLDGFLGVAGLDVPFAALAKALTLEGEVNPELAYAFLVDNNGIVYFHPRLQTPAASTFAVRKTLCHRLSTLLRSNTRVPFSRADELVHQQMGHLDSIGQSDILELEPSAGEEIWRRFRTNLVLGRCAETLEDERRQLRCFAIRGTPLVAGFVLNKGRPKIVLKEPPAEAEDPFELAERLRTALGSEEDAEATAENSNSNSNNSSSSQLPPTVGILLREDQLQQWELSLELSHAKGFNRFGKLLLPLLPKANAQWLAHLAALEPDSLFPKWASKWSGNESAVCPSRAPFVSAFLELRSSALAGRPGVVAAFPRCELLSIKSFLRLSASQEESAITRLTVHVDPAKDGGLLTVEQPLGLLDGRRPLARVGVQLRGHYLQQKMQRALQQPADGWAECLGAAGGAEERKCLLVNGDSFVLASSSSAGPTVDQSPLAFRPVHLSLEEPELFAEMQARGLIKRIAWRDPTGLCPMVMEMRHRQQHFPALYYMPASSEPPATASAPSAISMPAIVGQLLGLIPAWAALLFPALLHVHASTPVSEHIIEPLEDVDCEIEPQPELVEHCTLERSRFRLRARAKERPGDQPKTTALWLREKHCNRTVGLLPFGRSELFLLLLDGKCQQKPSAQTSPPPPPPSFVHQAQVPNCNLTLESLRQPRRARADLLIFGRSHPKEFNQICSSGANRPAAGGGLFSPVHALSLITSIFLLFLHLNSKFFFT